MLYVNKNIPNSTYSPRRINLKYTPETKPICFPILLSKDIALQSLNFLLSSTGLP